MLKSCPIRTQVYLQLKQTNKYRTVWNIFYFCKAKNLFYSHFPKYVKTWDNTNKIFSGVFNFFMWKVSMLNIARTRIERLMYHVCFQRDNGIAWELPHSVKVTVYNSRAPSWALDCANTIIKKISIIFKTSPKVQNIASQIIKIKTLGNLLVWNNHQACIINKNSKNMQCMSHARPWPYQWCWISYDDMQVQ